MTRLNWTFVWRKDPSEQFWYDAKDSWWHPWENLAFPQLHHPAWLVDRFSVFVSSSVTFTTAWTPYAVVAFISTFISPTLISPLGGTLPGNNWSSCRKILIHYLSILAIFAKSSVYFNPLVFIISNSYVRAKLLHWRRASKSASNSCQSRES